MAERLRVTRLGAGGDGVAEGQGGSVFVSYALPGETVLAEPEGRDRAALVAIETPSPDRAEPFCLHFGRCGGCVAQHMGAELYGGWKRARLVEALARAGVEAGVEPLVDAHGAGRRRVTFHARFADGTPRVGFMAARSHRLVAIERCPVAVPELAAAPAIAARLAAELVRLGKPLDVAVTATSAGLDVDIRGAGPGAQNRRQSLIRLALDLDLARLSLHSDVLVEARTPTVMAGTAAVPLPPGGFLQATAAGEAALSEEVLAGVDGARRVADLFAGIGPFALRVAAAAEVHAVDGDAAMLAALDRAARAAPGLRRVTTETRDLFRRPLLASELERFDAAVLDPPRAGAEAQVRQLIPSSLERVVMVSCDPGTFARDAAALAGGGFQAERIVPVDQFKWSAHLEMVGVFSRPGRRRQRRRS